MKKKKELNYEFKIFIGGKEGYRGSPIPKTVLLETIKKYQKQFEKDNDYVVSLRVNDTVFIVKDYEEKGWEISAINYPRFPKTRTETGKFIDGLAEHLLKRFKQNRISWTCGSPVWGATHLLEADDAEEG
jgi:hypothetical protein